MRGRIAIMFVVLTFLAGCDDHSVVTQPSPVDGPVRALSVTGDGPVVGSTTQLSAKASYEYGAVKDVTKAVTWESYDPTVLTVSSQGVATGIKPGQSRVWATYKSAETMGVPVTAAIDLRVFDQPGQQTVLTTISDTEFNPADWEVRQLAISGNATHSEVRGNDGNPGPYRSMEHDHTSNGALTLMHLFKPAAYTPSTDGAIVYIDYWEDHIDLAPEEHDQEPGVNALWTVGLIQDGQLYVASNNYSPILTGWRRDSLEGLKDGDFSSADGRHPDFSLLGSRIQFGYVRQTTASRATTSDSEAFLHAIDNWKVIISHK